MVKPLLMPWMEAEHNSQQIGIRYHWRRLLLREASTSLKTGLAKKLEKSSERKCQALRIGWNNPTKEVQARDQ